VSAPRQDPIDAALASGRVTATEPDDRELQALALALRDDAPRPDPAFERELDRRVAYGFKRPRRFVLPHFGGPWLPVLAGAAAIAIAVVVAVSLFSGGGSTSSTKSLSSQPPPSQAGRGGATAGATGRKVEHHAQITISAPATQLESVGRSVVRVTASHSGFVVSSKIVTGNKRAAGGRYVLRVPAGQLGAELADLGNLGTVRTRSESGHDMTASYNDVNSRLGTALDEQQSLTSKLAGASGSEADDIRNHLQSLSAEVHTLSAQARDLKRRTGFATVTVRLRAE
jgi:hypothetical protein